jgi:hypothetical protein
MRWARKTSADRFGARHALVAILLLFLSGVAWAPHSIGAGSDGRADYITGQLRVDQRAQASPHGPRGYNLDMEFTARSGAFLSEVRVEVIAADKSIALDVLSEGPRLVTTLAPGRYRIKATFAGRTLVKQIVQRQDRITALSFVWPVAESAA